jgi:hypothetical protein
MKAAVLKLKAIIPTENDECRYLLRWARLQTFSGWRISDLLVMIPNGAVLAGDARQRGMQMGKMKRAGFRTGVSDYFLAAPRGPYGGLWLEMKRRVRGVVSTDQESFQADMRGIGYATAIVKGWEEAKDKINQYLHGEHS